MKKLGIFPFHRCRLPFIDKFVDFVKMVKNTSKQKQKTNKNQTIISNICVNNNIERTMPTCSVLICKKINYINEIKLCPFISKY